MLKFSFTARRGRIQTVLSNRILAAAKVLAPARFTASSGGEVETANTENFGALSATAANTVRAYSVFLAADDGLLWIADMTTAVVSRG